MYEWRGSVDCFLYVVTNPLMISSNHPPEGGSWLIKSQHRGDCFYRFGVLSVKADGTTRVERSGEGGYDLRMVNGYDAAVINVSKLTLREYHLLLAGEDVDLWRFHEVMDRAKQEVESALRKAKAQMKAERQSKVKSDPVILMVRSKEKGVAKIPQL